MPAQSIPYRYRRQQQQDTQGSDQSDRLLMLLLQGWLQGNLQSEAMEGQSEARLKQIAAESLGARELERETQRGYLARDEARSNQVMTQQKQAQENTVAFQKMGQEFAIDLANINNQFTREQDFRQHVLNNPAPFTSTPDPQIQAAFRNDIASEWMNEKQAQKQTALLFSSLLDQGHTYKEASMVAGMKLDKAKKYLEEIQSGDATAQQQGLALMQNVKMGTGVLPWMTAGGTGAAPESVKKMLQGVGASADQVALISMFAAGGKYNPEALSQLEQRMGGPSVSQAQSILRSMRDHSKSSNSGYSRAELAEKLLSAGEGKDITIDGQKITPHMGYLLKEWLDTGERPKVAMADGPPPEIEGVGSISGFLSKALSVGRDPGQYAPFLQQRADILTYNSWKKLEDGGFLKPPTDNTVELDRMLDDMAKHTTYGSFNNYQWHMANELGKIVVPNEDNPIHVPNLIKLMGVAVGTGEEADAAFSKAALAMESAGHGDKIPFLERLRGTSQTEVSVRSAIVQGQVPLKYMEMGNPQATLAGVDAYTKGYRARNIALRRHNAEGLFKAADAAKSPEALNMFLQREQDFANRLPREPGILGYEAYTSSIKPWKDKSMDEQKTKIGEIEQRGAGQVVAPLAQKLGREGIGSVEKILAEGGGPRGYSKLTIEPRDPLEQATSQPTTRPRPRQPGG